MRSPPCALACLDRVLLVCCSVRQISARSARAQVATGHPGHGALRTIGSASAVRRRRGGHVLHAISAIRRLRPHDGLGSRLRHYSAAHQGFVSPGSHLHRHPARSIHLGRAFGWAHEGGGRLPAGHRPLSLRTGRSGCRSLRGRLRQEDRASGLDGESFEVSCTAHRRQCIASGALLACQVIFARGKSNRHCKGCEPNLGYIFGCW